MALSANIQGGRDSQGRAPRLDFQVENSERVYEGGFNALRDLGNATSGNRGYLGAYTGAAGEIIVGEGLPIREPGVSETDGDWTFDGSVLGDTSAAVPPAQLQRLEAQLYRNIAVTGVTSIADVMRLVYASDDNTLTLTPQTRPDPVGVVMRYRASGFADVWKLSLDAMFACARPQRIWLSTEPVVMTGTSGNKITGFPMPCKGLILRLGYNVTTEITGSPDTVLNAELGGTNVTGGTVALAAGSVGAYKADGAFATAAHYFSYGTLLDVEISGSTAAGAGEAGLFVDIIPLPGT